MAKKFSYERVLVGVTEKNELVCIIENQTKFRKLKLPFLGESF
jgi:hypothetical protein